MLDSKIRIEPVKPVKLEISVSYETLAVISLLALALTVYGVKRK